jgi:CelD/BcsL family acetyltransferase involved in cellulose biosynthesis
VRYIRSWAWVGCAPERFDSPRVLRAYAGDRLVGICLLNQPRRCASLSEAGDPARDTPYVEHNGPLVAADAPPGTEAALLKAALAGARRLRLSGVPPELPLLSGGVAIRSRADQAPFLDLEALRARGQDVFAALSPNARQQIRRSDRRLGPLRLDRAATVPEALDWLDALAALHQASWNRRGKPGAFAEPFFRRFHRELIGRAHPDGGIDLLRVAGGRGVVGYLYNFRHGGVVHAYQSGFADADLHPHEKPGLTAHRLAIQAALERGDREYDFLAGPQRYKLSFASGMRPLVWAEMAHPASLAGIARRLWNLVSSPEKVVRRNAHKT